MNETLNIGLACSSPSRATKLVLARTSMASPLAKMHQAVGRAVLMAQVFETVLVVCHELIGILRGESNSLISPDRFKEPTRNLIKKLSAANNIATEFEAQINDLVLKRHLLIHGWFRENGLPSDDNLIEIAKLVQLADDVEQKSKSIAALLAGYIVRWGELNPTELTRITESERQRLMAIFQFAHLGKQCK
jgi:hypothetical protein